MSELIQNEFEVGQRVILNSTNQTFINQAGKSEGTVIEIINNKWIMVSWNNGYTNSYPKNELMLLKEDDNKILIYELFNEIFTYPIPERGENDLSDRPKVIYDDVLTDEQFEEMFPYPLPIGTRIMINPESKIYKNEKNISRVGTIVEILDNYLICRNWKSMNIPAKKGILLRIKIDSNEKYKDVILTVMLQELLLLNEPELTVEKIKLNNGKTIENIKGQDNDLLNNYIIRQGYKIISKEVYDDNYRKYFKNNFNN